MEDVLDRVRELAKAFRADIHEKFSGVPIGHGRATDDEFLLLCLENAKNDPNWTAAVLLVDGGAEWVNRWERITNTPWETLNLEVRDGVLYGGRTGEVRDGLPGGS